MKLAAEAAAAIRRDSGLPFRPTAFLIPAIAELRRFPPRFWRQHRVCRYGFHAVSRDLLLLSDFRWPSTAFHCAGLFL